MRSEAVIYVIGSADGPQKIGISHSPRKRLSQIQSSSGLKLVLLHERSVPTDIAVNVERRAHWLLRERQCRGEWFSVAPHEAVAAVERAADERGEGERVGSLAGRKMLWPDKIVAPLPAGSLERIVAVLKPDEDKTDFLREAVDRELGRREEAKTKGRPRD